MLDYIAIFKTLNDEGMRYIVAGGVAVNLYGIPRMTYDIDLLIDLEEGNIQKLLLLLERWGFKPRVPVDPSGLMDSKRREEWIRERGLRAFTFVNPEWPISEIDILLKGPVGYKEAARRVRHFQVKGVMIPVVSIEDLIEMKRGTGRRQDEADIRYLERLRDER